MLFHKIKGTAVVSSGSWSANTLKFSVGYLRTILITPATSTTIFDFRMVDENSNVIFPNDMTSGSNCEGGLNVTKVDIPLGGVYTMQILNSTADEQFNYLLMVQED